MHARVLLCSSLCAANLDGNKIRVRICWVCLGFLENIGKSVRGVPCKH